MLKTSLPLALCLTSCLVSFEDYPVGELQGASAVAGEGGGNAAGRAPVSGGSSAGEDSLPTDGGAPAEVSAFDDFEHADDVIFELDGRKGDWYVSNDGRGLQTPRAGAELLPSPVEPPRGASSGALRTSGGPFFTWGALVGASLNSGEPYDLSGFRGIRLWVRSGAAPAGPGPVGPGAARQVRLNLTQAATSVGGGCTVCNDHFGADITLTEEWALVDLPLASLKQAGFGRPQLPLSLSEVVDLQLMFPANVSFDLWVDDIELYR